MRYILGLSALCILLWSCNDKPAANQTGKNIVKANTAQNTDFDTSAGASKQNLINFEKGKVSSTKKLANGIVIKWIKRGTGPYIAPRKNRNKGSYDNHTLV